MTVRLQPDLRTSAAFWVYTALAIFGAVRFLPLVVAELVTFPISGLVSAVLWLVYALVLGLLVYRADVFEQRSGFTVAAAFVWGAVVVTGIGVTASPAMAAIVASVLGDDLADWVPAIAAPLVEEPLKVLGVALLALMPATRIRSPLYGLFYGVFVGLGFQVAESFLYTMNAASVSDGSLEVVLAMFLLRGFVGGLWSHAAYTAISGAGAGYLFGSEGTTSRKWLVFFGMLALAIGLHGLFNSPLARGHPVVSVLIRTVPLLIALTLAVRLARRQPDSGPVS